MLIRNAKGEIEIERVAEELEGVIDWLEQAEKFLGGKVILKRTCKAKWKAKNLLAHLRGEK